MLSIILASLFAVHGHCAGVAQTGSLLAGGGTMVGPLKINQSSMTIIGNDSDDWSLEVHMEGFSSDLEVSTTGAVEIGRAGVGFTLDTIGNIALQNSSAHITASGVSGTVVPTGTLILSTSPCPAGFTEYAPAQGFYLAGMPSGGTAAGTIGSAMTNLSDATHSHSVTTMTATNTATLLGGATRVTSVTSPTGTVPRSQIAPYIQIRLCAVP